jgi:hypothetical protein
VAGQKGVTRGCHEGREIKIKINRRVKNSTCQCWAREVKLEAGEKEWQYRHLHNQVHIVYMPVEMHEKGLLPNLRFGASRPAETSDFRFQMHNLNLR